MLDAKGYTVKGENGIMKVMNGSMIIKKGPKESGLYILDAQTITGQLVSVQSKEMTMTELWHRKFEHISEKVLQELAIQGLLSGEKLVKMDLCDHCVYGKSHRVKFSTGQRLMLSIQTCGEQPKLNLLVGPGNFCPQLMTIL